MDPAPRFAVGLPRLGLSPVLGLSPGAFAEGSLLQKTVTPHKAHEKPTPPPHHWLLPVGLTRMEASSLSPVPQPSGAGGVMLSLGIAPGVLPTIPTSDRAWLLALRWPVPPGAR